MDDSQLDAELAALAGTPADESKVSEAETETPEGNEADADTETEAKSDDEGDKPESDEGHGDDEDEDKPKKAKLSGSQRLKHRLAAAEAELATLRSRQASDGEPTQDAIEREIGKPPKEEDFKGDFIAYERALTAYETDKRFVSRELRGAAAKAKAAVETARRDKVEAHIERVDEFRKRVPDFDKQMREAAKAGDLKVSPVVEDLLLDSDKSAHLQLYLAKNPDRLARLNDMSEREAAREIGRIESRLSLPNPKTKTQAPPPVKSPKGGAAPSSPEKDLDAWLSKKYGKR
jgi:hypothetical protein